MDGKDIHVGSNCDKIILSSILYGINSTNGGGTQLKIKNDLQQIMHM